MWGDEKSHHSTTTTSTFFLSSSAVAFAEAIAAAVEPSGRWTFFTPAAANTDDLATVVLRVNMLWPPPLVPPARLFVAIEEAVFDFGAGDWWTCVDFGSLEVGTFESGVGGAGVGGSGRFLLDEVELKRTPFMDSPW